MTEPTSQPETASSVPSQAEVTATEIPVDPSTVEHVVINLSAPITNGGTVVKSTQVLGD